ncbi:MAG: hypothetical protein ACKOEJ_03355, partial [Acidimicrobiaceae bacterium]
YLWKLAPAAKYRASILFSGSAHSAASAAAAELLERYDVGCELWSATLCASCQNKLRVSCRVDRLHRLAPTAWDAATLALR